MLSTASTLCSIHQVQHPLSTVSTQDWLSSLHSHDHELTAVCNFSFRHASLTIDHYMPAPFELKGEVNSSHPYSCKLTNQWTETQHPVYLPIDRLQINHLLVLLQFCSMVASKGISEVASHGLEVCMIIATNCISKVAPILHTCSHDYAPNCVFNIAWSRPPSASPNWHNHGLAVHLDTRSITATKFAQLLPPQVYLQTHSISIFSLTSNCSKTPHAASLDIPSVDG